jgi:hypothetical protein
MGTIKLTGTNGTVSLVDGNPTGDKTITLPNASGTMALQETSVQHNEYATATVGGTVKMRLDGSTLYIRNDGTNA